MNYGGDAAEQVVRMSLEGMDVALRISGSATKNLVAIIAAVLREEEKTRGKARLTNLLKSGKELTVFSIPANDLKIFTKEAKKYGALYYVVKDKHARDGIGTIDVLTRAEDAPKINRIVERFKLAAVNGGQFVSDAEKSRREDKPLMKQRADRLIDEVLETNPANSRTERGNLSGKNSGEMEQAAKAHSSKNRTSVKQKLEKYRNNDIAYDAVFEQASREKRERKR